jgi:hypothetical protein
MERYCSIGQSPQRDVAPTKEEEEEENYFINMFFLPSNSHRKLYAAPYEPFSSQKNSPKYLLTVF